MVDVKDLGQNEEVVKTVNVSKGDVSNLKLPSNFPTEIDIYFGSQTGTAEKFAKVLEEEVNELGVIARVVDMEGKLTYIPILLFIQTHMKLYANTYVIVVRNSWIH